MHYHNMLSAFASSNFILIFFHIIHDSACLQNAVCDFESENYLCDGWHEDHPVNVVWTITNASADLGIQHPPNHHDNKFLYITTANQPEEGFYCFRSRSFVLNRTHVLQFDYLLRASGNTNIKVFADINMVAGNFISFYQIDTNKQWVKGEAIIEVNQPQTTIEIEIRGDIQNSNDFVAIDDIRIIDATRPTTVSTTSSPSISTTWTSAGSISIHRTGVTSNRMAISNDSVVILVEAVSSQSKHSYSTLLIIMCICLSVLCSTLGMTLLLRRCYVYKQEFAMRSESSYSN